MAFISFIFNIPCIYSACFLDCFTELFYFLMVCKLEELVHLYCLQNQPKKKGNFRGLRQWQAFILVRPTPDYETQSWNMQTVPYKQ